VCPVRILSGGRVATKFSHKLTYKPPKATFRGDPRVVGNFLASSHISRLRPLFVAVLEFWVCILSTDGTKGPFGVIIIIVIIIIIIMYIHVFNFDIFKKSSVALSLVYCGCRLPLYCAYFRIFVALLTRQWSYIALCTTTVPLTHGRIGLPRLWADYTTGAPFCGGSTAERRDRDILLLFIFMA
jgi:hypothetical protein